jgi:hypothetical protein
MKNEKLKKMKNQRKGLKLKVQRIISNKWGSLYSNFEFYPSGIKRRFHRVNIFNF